MEETQENDSQEVQPEINEQGTDEPVVEDQEPEVNPEVEKLRAELADKDEQIANLSRLKREQKKEAKKSEPKPKANKQSDALDYGEKAYLNTKDIAESEHDFVLDQMKESGLELKDLLNNGYFQAKLKEQRDAKVVADATPSQTRGTTEPAKSKVEHWIQKGELPPDTPENRQLRADVVNARIAINDSANNFTQNPVIEG